MKWNLPSDNENDLLQREQYLKYSLCTQILRWRDANKIPENDFQTLLKLSRTQHTDLCKMNFDRLSLSTIQEIYQRMLAIQEEREKEAS